MPFQAVLMDKGIIIGVENETATRMNLPFVMFRHVTSVRSIYLTLSIQDLNSYQTHLFLHHVLRVHIDNGQIKEAVAFASHYQHLVFFAHALEILLHSVVEDDASMNHADTESDTDASDDESVLSRTIEFLDYFDVSMDVVVGCARKIEVTRWPRLFDVVGNPKTLFEVRHARSCLVNIGS